MVNDIEYDEGIEVEAPSNFNKITEEDIQDESFELIERVDGLGDGAPTLDAAPTTSINVQRYSYDITENKWLLASLAFGTFAIFFGLGNAMGYYGIGPSLMNNNNNNHSVDSSNMLDYTTPGDNNDSYSSKTSKKSSSSAKSGKVAKSCGKSNWDVALEWNKVAMNANIIDHDGPFDSCELAIFICEESTTAPASQGPAGSAHALAIIHTSMMEAFNCVVRKYESMSIDKGIDCEGASINVVIARAIYGIMNGVGSYTGIYAHNEKITTMVQEAYDDTLSRETDIAAREKGIESGKKIAMMVMEHRKDDGLMPDNPYRVGCPYTATGAPGTHRVDIFNPDQGYEGVCAGNMTPWGMTLEENRVYNPKPPPGYVDGGVYDIDNPEYIKSLLQVKELGYDRDFPDTISAPDETIPTSDECYVIANHWSANGSRGTGTPPAMYMDIARKIAIEKCNTMEENIVMFTSIALSMSNAAVNTWHAKWLYILWRPTIAIRNHIGTCDECKDKNWKRLGASRSNGYPNERNFDPNFGAYTSGHAAFGCATMQSIANFFGTYKMKFDHTTPEWNGKTYDMYNRTRSCLVRRYGNLKEMMAENAASRVCNGVHFDFDGKAGCKAGMDIANHVWQKTFLPMDSSRDVVTASDLDKRIDGVLMSVKTEGYVPKFCQGESTPYEGTPAYPYHED